VEKPPGARAGRPGFLRVRSLRTQQRAESQCQVTTPFCGFLWVDGYRECVSALGSRPGSSSSTSQSGEREADFINCVVWRKPAENVANFLKKGSLAGVDGRIQTRNYEGQDGKRVYVTEVQAESVQFLEPKSSSGGGGGRSNNDYYGAPPMEPQGNSYGSGNQNQRPNQNQNKGFTRVDEDPFAGTGQIDISDDDLPF
jgi:single-strand DNA-binding protein